MLIVRPEAALIYTGAEHVQDKALAALAAAGPVRHVVCDLSTVPSYMDLARAEVLRGLHETLAARGIRLWLVGLHARLRDLLRKAGVAEQVCGVERGSSVESAVAAIEAGGG